MCIWNVSQKFQTGQTVHLSASFRTLSAQVLRRQCQGGWQFVTGNIDVPFCPRLALKDVLEVDACGHFDEDGLDVPPFVYGGGLFPKEPPVEEIFAAEAPRVACLVAQHDLVTQSVLHR